MPTKSVRLIASICGCLYRVTVAVSSARALNALYRDLKVDFTGCRWCLGLEVLDPVGSRLAQSHGSD